MASVQQKQNLKIVYSFSLIKCFVFLTIRKPDFITCKYYTWNWFWKCLSEWKDKKRNRKIKLPAREEEPKEEAGGQN